MKEFLFSRNAVYESLRAGRREIFRIQISEGAQEKGRLSDILRLAKERRIPVERLPRARLDKIHPNHQGVTAEAGGYPYSDVVDILEQAHRTNEPPLILMIDALQDPQNFGSLLRTAEAVGAHGVILPLAHTVEVTPVVVNASSGASEHLRIARSNLSQAIQALKDSELWIIGLDQNGEELDAKTNRWMRGPLAVVVGGEGEGLRELTSKKCDALIKLPMHGQVESLNAAVAGSVLLYLVSLARNQ